MKVQAIERQRGVDIRVQDIKHKRAKREVNELLMKRFGVYDLDVAKTCNKILKAQKARKLEIAGKKFEAMQTQQGLIDYFEENKVDEELTDDELEVMLMNKYGLKELPF